MHVRTHTGERPHQCSHCGKAFVRKSHLVNHLRTHTGERPHQCHLCPMAFSHKTTLARHVRSHTRERPFRCRFCPQTFTRRFNQMEHERKEHSRRSSSFFEATRGCGYKFSEAFRGTSCLASKKEEDWSALVGRCIMPGQRGLPGTIGDAPASFMLVLCLAVTVFVSGRALTFFPLPPVSGPSPNGHRGQQGPLLSGRLLQCHQCSYRAPYPSRLKMHVRTHTGERPHHCSHCGEAFVRKSHLVNHLRTHTGERPHQCSHCSKVFARKNQLVVHLRIHTGERPHECHLCPMAFAQKTTLANHLRSHTGERPFRCRFCPKTFTRRLSQKEHEQKEHSRRHCEAIHGKVTGPSPNGHRGQQGPLLSRRLLQCHQCSYRAPYPSRLKMHVRTHTGERPHQCSHCGEAFVRKSHLVNHLRTHTGERPHQCSHCGKVFARKDQLVVHLRIHTGERPHECHLCPMAFAHKATLASHVRSHTGERPFRCLFCPQTFSCRLYQKEHEQKEHSRSSCGYKFSEAFRGTSCLASKKEEDWSALVGRCIMPGQRGLPGTIGDAPASFMLVLCLAVTVFVSGRALTFFFPSSCFRSFPKWPQGAAGPLAQSSSAAVPPVQLPCALPKQIEDARTHAHGEAFVRKPRRSHCGEAFVRKSHLVNHLRTHTGERPYQCSHCGKVFARKDQLVVHLRIHTGELPHECHLCPMAFAHKATLASHVRSQRGRGPSAASSAPRPSHAASTRRNTSRRSTAAASRRRGGGPSCMCVPKRSPE
ncbi:uncharacterized protein LOC144160149 [Haemaphysalis longicornis]